MAESIRVHLFYFRLYYYMKEKNNFICLHLFVRNMAMQISDGYTLVDQWC